MTVFKLMNHHHPEIAFRFSHIPGAVLSDDGPKSGVVATYDSQSDEVRFDYPKMTDPDHVRMASVEILRVAPPALTGAIKFSNDSDHFTFSLERKAFERHFQTNVKLALDHPYNLVVKFAPDVKGTDHRPLAKFDPRANKITLVYDHITADHDIDAALKKLKEGIAPRHALKISFDRIDGAFTVSMPAATYEALTEQKINLGRHIS